MDLRRANLLRMLFGLAVLLFIALFCSFHQFWMLMAGSGSFLAMMAVWFLFYRCPHCKKHLGREVGLYCPYCGKKL